MDQMVNNPGVQPADPAGQVAFMATAILVGKIIALRGQPLNKGDITACVADAATLLSEVTRLVGG